MGELSSGTLRGSESILATAWFDSLEDPMLLCDASLVVLAANRAAARLLQIPPAELIHRKAHEVLVPPAPAGARWRVVSQGSPTS